MKIYTVHTKNGKPEETNFVHEGFNWLAMIFPFNVIWAISHRMWLFLLLFVAFFVGSVALDVAHHEISNKLLLFKVVIILFFGLWGNDLRRFSLKNRGYDLASVVTGKTEVEAQLRFLEDSTKVKPGIASEMKIL